jgi:hypothetical protein
VKNEGLGGELNKGVLLGLILVRLLAEELSMSEIRAGRGNG